MSKSMFKAGCLTALVAIGSSTSVLNAVEGAYQCGHKKAGDNYLRYGSDATGCTSTGGESCNGGSCTLWYVTGISFCTGGVVEGQAPCKYCSEYHDDGTTTAHKYNGSCFLGNASPVVCDCSTTNFTTPIDSQPYPEIYAVGGSNCYKCPPSE